MREIVTTNISALLDFRYFFTKRRSLISRFAWSSACGRYEASVSLNAGLRCSNLQRLGLFWAVRTWAHSSSHSNVMSIRESKCMDPRNNSNYTAWYERSPLTYPLDDGVRPGRRGRHTVPRPQSGSHSGQVVQPEGPAYPVTVVAEESILRVLLRLFANVPVLAPTCVAPSERSCFVLVGVHCKRLFQISQFALPCSALEVSRGEIPALPADFCPIWTPNWRQEPAGPTPQSRDSRLRPGGSRASPSRPGYCGSCKRREKCEARVMSHVRLTSTYGL